MKAPLIEGERIYLRRVVVEDATPEYAAWLNDPETTRYMETSGGQTVESVRDYILRYKGREDALFMAIVLKEGDRHIGNVKLEPIDRRNRSAVVGIMIGDPSSRGQGLGTEAMVLALRYAFDRLGLHRVGLGVTADNEAGLRCYRKVGFREEGRLRESSRRGDRYVDGIWMGILDREFRKRYGHDRISEG